MVFPPFEFQKSHTGKIRGLDIEALSFYGGQTGDVLKRNPSPRMVLEVTSDTSENSHHCSYHTYFHFDLKEKK
jgi:hypothetical protein